MAKESMAQLRDRVRKQVAQAHVQPETALNDTLPKSETTAGISSQQVPHIQEVQASSDMQTKPSSPKLQKRRRSRWVNPYPDAIPFQISVYLTEEDLVLIKSLRLKFRFAREWMVIKYALEKLDQDIERRDTK